MHKEIDNNNHDKKNHTLSLPLIAFQTVFHLPSKIGLWNCNHLNVIHVCDACAFCAISSAVCDHYDHLNMTLTYKVLKINNLNNNMVDDNNNNNYSISITNPIRHSRC